MPAPSDDHDRLAWRLTAILLKLNQGARVIPDELADEFGVHVRTIRSDLTERFASLAGLQGLFPALDAQFFRELFDSRLQDTVSVHGHQFEDVSARTADFRLLQQAILHHQAFDYAKPDGVKTVQAHPYQLISHAGVWYLAPPMKASSKPMPWARCRPSPHWPKTSLPVSRCSTCSTRKTASG